MKESINTGLSELPWTSVVGVSESEHRGSDTLTTTYHFRGLDSSSVAVGDVVEIGLKTWVVVGIWRREPGLIWVTFERPLSQ